MTDWIAVSKNAPGRPTRDTHIEIDVVARRCVYVNNHRVAGGKPYYSENLPQHTLKTTLGEVLDAFTEKQIRAALKEAKAHRDYYAAIHKALAAAAREGGDVKQAPGEAPQSGRRQRPTAVPPLSDKEKD